MFRYQASKNIEAPSRAFWIGDPLNVARQTQPLNKRDYVNDPWFQWCRYIGREIYRPLPKFLHPSHKRGGAATEKARANAICFFAQAQVNAGRLDLGIWD
jgi:hypothetical protein